MDWRLSGVPVRATASQAMEATTALSRGEKAGLRPRPGSSSKVNRPAAQRCHQSRMELGCRST